MRKILGLLLITIVVGAILWFNGVVWAPETELGQGMFMEEGLCFAEPFIPAVFPKEGGRVTRGETEDGLIWYSAEAVGDYNFVGWVATDGRLLSLEETLDGLSEDIDVVACFASSEPVDGEDLFALVSKHTTLGQYAPSDVVDIPASMTGGRSRRIREAILDELVAMIEAAAEDGVTLTVVSAYRSYDSQARIFSRYVRDYGEEAANRFSARPGQSEHQLGTTLDFGDTPHDWSARFADTPAGKWLRENAHYFGFAMSYPRDSEEITGYIFEPWHYRYIGMEAALEWHESGLTLFEYLWFRQLRDAGLTGE